MSASHDPGGGRRAGRPPLALVADDDEDILGLVAMRLEAMGYTVITASDGAQALALAEERGPELIVLDVAMPVASGLEVTRCLREREETRDLPVILLTAHTEEADIERGFDAGATAYARKPFSPRELTEIVERVRANHTLRARELELGMRAAGEAALRRVATAVAAALPPRTVSSLVAEESARLLGADMGRVYRFSAGEGVITGAWGRPLPLSRLSIPLRGGHLVARVFITGRPARIDDYAALRAQEAEGPAPVPREYRSGVAAPVRFEGRLWGAIMVVSTGSTWAFGAGAEQRLGGFADLVALSIGSSLQRERLARLASTDHLTGLPNRRAFDERLGQALAWARGSGRPLSLAMLDLDHFKRVNDLHGHETGDRVLAETARRLSAESREGETIARVGGEEFAWILPDADEDGAYRAAERARRALVTDPFPVVGHMTASAGISELAAGIDAAELLRRADAALYEAKRSGRGICVRYSTGLAKLSS